MKNVAEVHLENLEVNSECKFLTQEIDFFLKLLKKSYSHTRDRDKIKIFDAYWKQFEALQSSLIDLMDKIRAREKDITILLKDDLADVEQTQLKDGEIIKVFYETLKEIRVLKESFFSFMSNNSEECKCS
ncbi:MAG: hypothetical protein ACK4ND_03495 [Cytophagaceae bacterium]